MKYIYTYVYFNFFKSVDTKPLMAEKKKKKFLMKNKNSNKWISEFRLIAKMNSLITRCVYFSVTLTIIFTYANYNISLLVSLSVYNFMRTFVPLWVSLLDFQFYVSRYRDGFLLHTWWNSFGSMLSINKTLKKKKGEKKLYEQVSEWIFMFGTYLRNKKLQTSSPAIV